MKLSDRLEDAATVACNPLDVALYREAAALAKRYEDAPVDSVGALPGSNGGFGAVCLPREFVGQRVRIVLDKEG